MPLGDSLSGINVSVGDLGQIFQRFFGDASIGITESIDENTRKQEQIVRELSELTGLTASQIKNQKEINLSNTKNFKKIEEVLKQTGLSRKELQEAVKKDVEELNSISEELKKLRYEDYKKQRTWGGDIKSALNRNKDALVKYGFVLKSVGTVIAGAVHQSMIALNKIDEYANRGFDANTLLSRFSNINQRSINNPYKFRSSGLQQFGASKRIQETFGVTAEYSDNTLDDIASYGLMLNIADEEAMGYLDTLRQINGESLDHNNLLLKQLVLISKDINVSYTKMFEMMSENTEFFAKYSGIGFRNTVKAAGAARRLGLNFSSVAETLGGMTKLDDILQRQMKASIFLGQGFNLMEAARYQFYGQTDKAMKSLMNQLSTIDESQFNQPYMRQILAEQMNMSIGDLQKMYRTARSPRGREQANIQANFNQSVEKLSDSINQIGFGKLQKSFTENILNPLANFFGESAPFVKAVISGVDWLLSVGGSLLKSVNSILGGIQNILGNTVAKWVTGLLAVGGLILGRMKLRSALASDRNNILRQILYAIIAGGNSDYATIAGTTFGRDGSIRKGKKGTTLFGRAAQGFGSKNGGGFMGSAKGKIGAATLGALALTSGFKGEMPEWLSGAITGGSIGAYGGLWPALVGAVIGGIAGGSMGYIRENMASGGIVPNGYNNDTFRANLSSQEAVIPLNSPEGQAFIKKIASSGGSGNVAEALKNMKLALTVNVNNKNDGRERSFKTEARLSSNLVEVG